MIESHGRLHSLSSESPARPLENTQLPHALPSENVAMEVSGGRQDVYSRPTCTHVAETGLAPTKWESVTFCIGINYCLFGGGALFFAKDRGDRAKLSHLAASGPKSTS